VADTGGGIDASCQARLFEPFFTGFDVSHHSSGHYEFGRRGMGLGLSIARAFVEMHDGTITCKSEPGKGSVFTITLPTSARVGTQPSHN
jgi:signal transduction histidine kinase